MADILKMKRGLKANLPALAQGEPGYALDTKELFIGGVAGNDRQPSAADVAAQGDLLSDHGEIITQAQADITAVSNKVSNLRRFAGRTVVADGDSITMGQIATNPGVFTDRKWPTVFAEITGAVMTNNAITGSTWATKAGMTQEQINGALCNKVDTFNYGNFEYAMFLAGVNDYGFEIAMGNNGDTVKTTFKGALNYALNKLRTSYPTLKIVLLTPIFAATSRVFNTLGYTVTDYVEAIKVIAAKYSVPVIDLHRAMNISEQNYTSYYWDGLHPVTATYEKLGQFIAGAMENLAATKQARKWKLISLGGNAAGAVIMPMFYVDNEGFCHLRGRLAVGTGSVGMPASAVPQAAVTLTCMLDTGVTKYLIVNENGVITYETPNVTYCLDSVAPYFVGTPEV